MLILRIRIPKGSDTCDWCGHKKEDNDYKGFFPHPFIFKPPGEAGGSLGKRKIIIPVHR